MLAATSPTNAGSGCVDIGPERKHLLMDGTPHQAFDLSIARNQRHAERRERGTAAVLATFPRLNGWAFADTIDLIHKSPRVPVGHIHRPACGGNRATRTNILKQLDFAGSDAPLRVKIDVKAQ